MQVGIDNAAKCRLVHDFDGLIHDSTLIWVINKVEKSFTRYIFCFHSLYFHRRDKMSMHDTS